jgi:hypothetical protein
MAPVEPDSVAARLARDVAEHYQSPALVNHCHRAYLFAASYGERHAIAFDAELLYVAAMLHDFGLVADFDSHTIDFEQAGGSVAWVFTAGLGWPAERRTRTAEIIVRHMWPEVDPELDAEGHLLQLSTSLDISGARPGDWPPEVRAEIVERFPRLDLASRFLSCFEDQARRKPSSSAARSVGNGIAERMRANPLER